MSCEPHSVASWYDWAHAGPISPLDLIANAEIVSAGGTDVGVFVNSATYRVPAIPFNLLKVIGGRVINSLLPSVLNSLKNPITTINVGQADLPDRIEIDFNFPPDPGTTTTASFEVVDLSSGAIGSTTLTFSGPTTARLQLGSPLPLGNFAVRLSGTTVPPITGGGLALDGEAITLPSGDGLPGGDFLFGVNVLPGSLPLPPPAPQLVASSNWNPSQITMAGLPICTALEFDNKLKVADAAQWTYQHLTADLDPQLALPLAKVLFLRGSKEWRMDIPLNLGYLSYSELLLSALSNAGTRGDCQGTVPAVLFNKRTYSGNVTLRVTLKQYGQFAIGIRAADTNGYYSMYESLWNVVK